MQDKEVLDQSEDPLTTVGENNSGKKGEFKDHEEDTFEEISKKEQPTKDGKFAFRKMKQPKKEKADKKNNRSTKFAGDGESFKAKLIGVEEVSDARGDKMCQDSMFRLKMNVKNQGPHKRKIIVSVSLEGIKIKDEKSGDLIYHHPVPRISFISQDISDARAFGYVASSSDGIHEFIAIKTEKPAFHVVLALRDLFQTVLSLKQEKMEQAKEKQTGDQDTASSIGSDSLNEKSSFQEDIVKSSFETGNKTKQENIYFDVIVSEPFPVKESDADLSPTSSEEKETKTVDDLLCLQDELNKLQQGIAQMDTSIAAVTNTVGVKDPFDTSFLTPGAPKMDTFTLPMPAPVPVAASVSTPYNLQQTIYEDKYAVFNAVDNEPSIFESALNKDQTDVAVPELHDLEDEIKRKSATPPAKPPRNSKTSDLSIFAELDPLGKDRPYKDKTEFFQELKNPPKKVLKDLLDSSNSSSHEDLLNRAFDSGIGSPTHTFPLSPSELISQQKQSLASSLPNSFLSNMKFSAFNQNGNCNPFNPFGNETNGFTQNHVNGHSHVHPGNLSPNNHLNPGSKRDSLGSSVDSDSSSPIPIPSRSQQFFEQRERALSSGSVSTAYSQSPCPLDSSRSSSQADVAGSSPVAPKLSNGHVNHDKLNKTPVSDSNSINGTSDLELNHSHSEIPNGKAKHNSVSRPRPRPSISKGNSLTNGGGITLPHPTSTSASLESEYINRENMQSIANMLQVHGRRARAASLPVDNHRIPYPAEKNIFAKKSDPFGDEFFCSLPKKVTNHIPSAAEIPEYA